MPDKKLDLEIIALILFAGAFLWFASSNILGNQLNHQYPIGFFASDSFQNYGIAEGLKEQGNYFYQPAAVAGGYKDVPGLHYPIIYHLAVIFANLAGITTHDSLIFVAILLLLGTALTVYLLIRKFSKNAAILSLPLMLLASYGKFSLAITFGQHGLIAGSFFLAAFLWALTKFDLEEVIFLAIFLSASMLGHAPEFVFSVIFMAFYLLIKLLTKQFRLSYIKKLMLIGISTFILTIYYYLILKGTWIAQGYSKLEFVTVKQFMEGMAFPPVLFSQDFHLAVLLAFGVGLVLAITLFAQKKESAFPALIFLVMLGFSNYVGYGHKAFQQRFLWPIYMAAFVGLAIYFGVKLLLKKVTVVYALLIFLLLSAGIVWAYSGKTQPSSMMDPYHWDSFIWIQKNVPKESTVYFFYQDFTTQHSLYYASSQRKSYVIEFQAFIEAVKNGKILREYVMGLSAEAGAKLPYRKSLFKYGFHVDEEPKTMEDSFDICSMEYAVFDKLSRQQVFADYNIKIMNELKKNPWIVEVYSGNPLVSILKNSKPGEKCIDEQPS